MRFSEFRSALLSSAACLIAACSGGDPTGSSQPNDTADPTSAENPSGETALESEQQSVAATSCSAATVHLSSTKGWVTLSTITTPRRRISGPPSVQAAVPVAVGSQVSLETFTPGEDAGNTQQVIAYRANSAGVTLARVGPEHTINGTQVRLTAVGGDGGPTATTATITHVSNACPCPAGTLACCGGCYTGSCPIFCP